MKYVKFPFDIIVNAKEILYKYYNINYHFAFIDELGFTMDENKSEQIEDDRYIPLFWDITFERFRQILTGDIKSGREIIKFKDTISDPIRKKTKLNIEEFEEKLTTVLEIMYIIAYSFHKKTEIDNDTIEEYYRASAKRDLLELYIHSHNNKLVDNPKCNKIQIRYSISELIDKKKKPEKDNIRSTKMTLDLDNNSNWFFRVFVADNLVKHLPTIKNIEDAKRELEALKPKLGRKLDYEHKDIVIYGTYLILKELFNIKTKNEGILNFVSRVNMCYLNKYYFKDEVIGFLKDDRAIKADIDYIKKKKKCDIFLSKEVQYVSISDLENSGTAPLFMDFYS